MISSTFHLFFWTEQIATDCHRPPREVSTKSKPGGGQQRLNDPGAFVATKYAFHRDGRENTRYIHKNHFQGHSTRKSGELVRV